MDLQTIRGVDIGGSDYGHVHELLSCCEDCYGDGWYAGHEDRCYEGSGCSCSGVQIECRQCGGTGFGRVRLDRVWFRVLDASLVACCGQDDPAVWNWGLFYDVCLEPVAEAA